MKQTSKQTQTEVVLVKGKDGHVYSHAVEGLIFKKTRNANITSYSRVDIPAGVVLENLPGFKSLLVRHGTAGEDCVYYPLPLVLASKEDRVRIAQEQGRRPVSERWVGRLRYSLGRLSAPIKD